MSYNVTVTVTDGKAEVSTSGPVPDGKLIVAGHSDEFRADLSVTAQTLDNRYVQSAASVAYKEK